MRQGEVWLINLDPTIGAEIHKTRPSIIVSDDTLGRLPLKVIVPITDWKEHYELAPWMVKLVADKTNNLLKDSSADCFQVRSVSESRFVRKVGNISQSQLEKIKISLAKVFSIGY